MLQKKWVLALLPLILLASCFGSESEEERFPPLTQAEITGCWKMEQPEGLCRVDCFDSTGLFFSASRSDASLPVLAERLGSFQVSKNSLHTEYQIKNSQGFNSAGNSQFSRTIIDQKMRDMEGDELTNIVYARVHPDSFPCGLKPWVLFPKPATWTLF